MADQLEFKISESLVKPILEAKINAAIVESMGGHEKMITDILTAYMNQTVDGDGKQSTYSSAKPRLHWLVQRMIEEAMKASLTEYMQTKKEFLIKEFERFFNSKKGSSKIIAAMQDGFCNALTDKWRTTITFNPPN